MDGWMDDDDNNNNDGNDSEDKMTMTDKTVLLTMGMKDNNDHEGDLKK